MKYSFGDHMGGCQKFEQLVSKPLRTLKRYQRVAEYFCSGNLIDELDAIILLFR